MKAQFDFSHGIPVVKHIGAAEVIPIPLNHPVGYGYKILEGNASFVFLPDSELDYQHEGGRALYEYVNFCYGADLLVHDGQYTDEEYRTREGWGHNRYSSAIDLAVRAKVTQLALFHHDPDHDDEEMDRIQLACDKKISQQRGNLHCFVAKEGTEVSL